MTSTPEPETEVKKEDVTEPEVGGKPEPENPVKNAILSPPKPGKEKPTSSR